MSRHKKIAKTSLLLWMLVALLPSLAQTTKPASTDLGEFISYSKNPGELRTSVVTYQNSKGQHLDLYSAIHIGSEAYYKALNERFKAYDSVLYELILPDEMVGQRLPAQMETGSGISGMQGMIARSLGLSSQIDKIDYSANNFVHADLTQSGLSQKMAERQESLMTYLLKALASSASVDQSSLGVSEEELAQVDMMAVLSGQTSAKDRKILRKLFAATLSSSGGLLSGLNDTALIAERNKAALKVLDQQSKAGKRNMALYYGAAHMPDLEKRLQQQGWKKSKTDWIKAWSI